MTRHRLGQVVLLLAAVVLTSCASSGTTPVTGPATESADGTAAATTRAPSDSPSAEPTERVVVRVGAADPIRAEVADTEAERARGLMGRPEVAEGTGMAFRYDAPAQGAFWMYRTLVPLSIVWAVDGRVVGVKEMTPCDSTDSARCPRYVAPAPYDLAVETAAGAFTAAGVQAGDPVVIEPAPTRSAG